MARRYWPGASPIGKRVRFTDQDIWREVVGIVGDVKHWGLDAPVNPELYMPTTQFSAFAMTWVLQTNGDPLALVPIAQRHVREIDREPAAVPGADDGGGRGAIGGAPRAGR